MDMVPTEYTALMAGDQSLDIGQPLDPSLFRAQLVAASVYCMAWEMLRFAITGRVREFFSNQDLDGSTISAEYQSTVETKHKSKFIACQLWLKEMGAIDEADVETCKRLTDLRNRLVHNLFEVIFDDGFPDEYPRVLAEIKALVRKIETWWIRDVWGPADPAFDGMEIDAAEIVPGLQLGIEMLLALALDDRGGSQAP